MYYSFFIESASFGIVERGVYDSTPIVSKKLHDGRSSDLRRYSLKRLKFWQKLLMKT